MPPSSASKNELYWQSWALAEAKKPSNSAMKRNCLGDVAIVAQRADTWIENKYNVYKANYQVRELRYFEAY